MSLPLLSTDEPTASTIGYREKKHQDWFDERIMGISTILEKMH